MHVTKTQMRTAIKNFTAEVDDEIDIREDYSGRGMYGRTCFGVVGSSPALAFRFAFALAEAVYPEEEDYHDLKECALELVEEMRTDSMAWDTIYYFPGLIVEDDDPEDED